MKIKAHFESLRKFTFQTVTTDKLKKEIPDLDDSKAKQCEEISAKILKENIDICLVELTNIINSSFQNGCFHKESKMVEVFPIFKKKDSLDIENSRPVSILSHMSKVFEKLMYEQTDHYMNVKLPL